MSLPHGVKQAEREHTVVVDSTPPSEPAWWTARCEACPWKGKNRRSPLEATNDGLEHRSHPGRML
jgi:hypothetical protein